MCVLEIWMYTEGNKGEGDVFAAWKQMEKSQICMYESATKDANTMAKRQFKTGEALEFILSNESLGDVAVESSDTWCSEEEYSQGIDPFEDNKWVT